MKQVKTMREIHVTKLWVVLAMLLSIARGPTVASISGCCAAKNAAMPRCCGMACCCGMPCCAQHGRQPAQDQPAPVQRRVGQELSAALTAVPFSVLFTCVPVEPVRAPRELFAGGHAPEPLAAGCIRLI